MEAKLEKRIQRIEDEMQGKVHSMRCYRQSGTLRNEAQEILQTWVSLKQLFLNTQDAAIALKNTSVIKQGPPTTECFLICKTLSQMVFTIIMELI